MANVLVVFTITVLLFVLTYIYVYIQPRPFPGIPYDKNVNRGLLGDLPSFQKYGRIHGDPLKWFYMQCDQLQEPLIQVFLQPFSRYPTLVLADHAEIQDILVRRTKEFDRGPYVRDRLHGIAKRWSIVTPTADPEFKNRRKLFQDVMSKDFVNGVAARHVYECTIELVELWKLKCRLAQSHPFSALQDLEYAVFGAMWSALFGSKLNIQRIEKEFLTNKGDTGQVILRKDVNQAVVFPTGPRPKVCEAAEGVIASFRPLITSPVPVLHHFLLRQFTALGRHLRIKDAAIMEVLSQSRAKFISGGQVSDVKSALDLVFHRMYQDPKYTDREALSDEVMRDELFGFLIAAFETSATTLAWGSKYLSDNQHTQHKLRDALNVAFKGTTQPSVEQIMSNDIPYLDAIIEEILRHSTPAPATQKEAQCDTQILGHHIPKGTQIFMATGHAGTQYPEFKSRNASSSSSREKSPSWDAATIALFDPERWLRKNPEGEVSFNSRAGPTLPFSAGIRGCFGKPLAYVELRIILALIILNFELKPVPEKLNNYRAIQGATRVPEQCYVRLAEAP